MNLKTLIGQLRILAILEGISYLSLGITMPVKRIMNIPEPNFIVGMIHGILFIAYCSWVILNHFERKWSYKTTAILMVSSLVPFMTFWAERKILKSEK